MTSNCVSSTIRLAGSRFIQFYDYVAKDGASNGPTVLYVPGFQGSGHGLKSQELIKHCQSKDLRYICYDPEATGESKVSDLSTLQFKHWFENAQAAIEKADTKNLVLVGSSMGGWISLKMASEFPNLVKGLLLIAPAVNFLRPKYQEWYANTTKQNRQDQDDGKLTIMDPSYGTVPVSKAFVQNSSEMEFESGVNTINVTCPVKIIHGVQDETVPFKNSLKVMEMIRSDNVELVYVKSGDHRMQNETGLEIIKKNLDDLLTKI